MSSFISALPDGAVATLSEIGHLKDYGDEDWIHGPDRPSEAMFGIRKGKVRFRNTTRDGRVVEIAMFGPGSWFGDIALMAGRPPPHDAYAVGNVTLLCVPRSNLFAALERDSHLTLEILMRLAEQFHDTHLALHHVRSLSTTQQVESYLDWLAVNSEDVIVTETGHEVRITQSALADRIGVSRVTIGKALERLEDRGRLQRLYGHILMISNSPTTSGSDPS